MVKPKDVFIKLLFFFVETKLIVTNLVKTIQRDFAEEFKNVVATLPQEVALSLQQVFTD